MKTRILESGICTITQNYSASHPALDIVKEGHQLDYIVAHSDGKVIFYQDGYDNMKGSFGNIGYGNFVRIDHGNGFVTMYAHMRKGLEVKNGQIVKNHEYISNLLYLKILENFPDMIPEGFDIDKYNGVRVFGNRHASGGFFNETAQHRISGSDHRTHGADDRHSPRSCHR